MPPLQFADLGIVTRLAISTGLGPKPPGSERRSYLAVPLGGSQSSEKQTVHDPARKKSQPPGDQQTAHVEPDHSHLVTADIFPP